MNCCFIALFVLLSFQPVHSQLPNGSVAPDFDVEDVYGNVYSLYAMMGNNKSACVGFEATWCGFCWHFHESHVLDQVVNNLGNSTTAIMLESDWKTNTECLFGPAGCNDYTWGDWVTGMPYRIANLSATNGPTVASEYYHNYYPLLYVISPDKRTWEIIERTYSNYSNWITKSFALNATATITHSTCGDNGKIILNVTGGHGAISYKWTNGTKTKDLNNISGGTYSVTLTDGNGYFKSFGPFIVEGPEKRVDVVGLELNHVKCYNESSGSILVQLDYGTAPYQYKWSNGVNQAANTNLKVGNYQLTVTDVKNCSIVRSYTLTQPTDLTATATGQRENCDQQDGKINLKALGGFPPYLFDIGEGNQSKSEFANLKGGKTYYITVTDANLCTEVIKQDIEVTHKPRVDAGTNDSWDCIKQSILLNGNNSEQANWFQYLWNSPTGTILNGAETLTPWVANPGTYYLKITNTNNACVGIDSVQLIDERVFPDIQATGDTVLNCAFLESIIHGESKNPAAKFYWSQLEDSSYYRDQKSMQIDLPGHYVFHVKDTLNECISLDTVRILENKTKPIASIEEPSYLSCMDSIIQLDALNSSQGTTYEYQWTTLDGQLLSGLNSLNPSISKPGNYTLQVLDKNNFCTASDTQQVFMRNLPQANYEQSISGKEVVFSDQSIGFPDSWYWTFGDGTFSFERQAIHQFQTEGSFEVCLKVQNDCGQDSLCKNLLIGIASSLSVVHSEIKMVTCFGGNDGAIQITVQGGIPPYVYKWNNQQTTQDLLDIPAGNYQVEISDQQGTKIIKNYTVDQPTEINLVQSDIIHANSGKSNGSIFLEMEGGHSPFKYNWTNGSTDNPILDLDPGKYYCTVSDVSNCQKELGPFVVSELTGSSSFNFVDKFELIPNPVIKVGIIDLVLSEQRPYTLRIVNMYGQTIRIIQSEQLNLKLSIDFSTFPKSLYFVILNFDNNSQTLRWLVSE